MSRHVYWGLWFFACAIVLWPWPDSLEFLKGYLAGTLIGIGLGGRLYAPAENQERQG